MSFVDDHPHLSILDVGVVVVPQRMTQMKKKTPLIPSLAKEIGMNDDFIELHAKLEPRTCVFVDVSAECVIRSDCPPGTDRISSDNDERNRSEA